jgi:hypothetical protein
MARSPHYIAVHPAPKFTCTNCTGSADAVDLSQAPPGAPLYSYSKRTYSGGASMPPVNLWGNVQSIKVSITPSSDPIQLEAYVALVTSKYAQAAYNPFFNLKIAGQRTITPSSVAGQQPGDTNLSLPDFASWFSTGLSYAIHTNGTTPTVWPTITIEVATDQGIVNP